MAFSLYSIDEAVDHKYIVVKSIKEQVKKGTLVHIMDAIESSDGITVKYSVTKTNQDLTVRFNTIKQFCNWCMPSSFLAKYYNKLSYRDVIKYIQAENRSFPVFHLPIILISLAIIWSLSMLMVYMKFIELPFGLIIGGALSVICIVCVFVLTHVSKTHMIEQLYEKVSKKQSFL